MTIREVISSSIELSWRECLALAQSVAAASGTGPWRAPQDVLDDFALGEDGVVSAARAGATAVSFLDLATFLARLLPGDSAPAGLRAPSGVSFTIARALGKVEAPPFDSLEEFSQSLARFEQGERRQLLRVVFTRYSAVRHGRVQSGAGAPVSPGRRERRSSGPGADVMRRLLREADRELFTTRQTMAELRHNGPGPDVLRRFLRDEDRRNFDLQAVAASTRTRGARIVLWRRHRAVAGVAVLLIAAAAMAERQPIRTAWHSLAQARLVSPRAEADAGRPPAALQESRTVGTSRGRVGDNLSSHPAYAANRTRATWRPTDVAGEASTGSGSSRWALAPLPALPENSGRLVLAVDVAQRPIFSPSFEGYRSALFDASTQRGVLDAGGVASSVRVLSIADDRGHNYHPALSPDGRTIAFDSDHDGVRGVYVASRDGRNVRRVSGPDYAAFAAWSPDGNHLAFVRSEPGQAAVWNVWSLNVQSGAMARLTAYHSGQPWGVSWFPDSRRICYAHEGEIAVLDTMTGETYVWASPRADRMTRMPLVSPDGKRVLFQVDNDGAWLLELADGSMREVLADATAQDFAWSPDGRSLVFRTQSGGWTSWSLEPGSDGTTAADRRP